LPVHSLARFLDSSSRNDSACGWSGAAAFSIRRNGLQKVIADGQIHLLGGHLYRLGDLAAIESMIPRQTLLNKLAQALLNFRQPSAYRRFVYIEQLADLAQGHLVIVVISQQQSLARLEIVDGSLPCAPASRLRAPSDPFPRVLPFGPAGSFGDDDPRTTETQPREAIPAATRAPNKMRIC